MRVEYSIEGSNLQKLLLKWPLFRKYILKSSHFLQQETMLMYNLSNDVHENFKTLHFLRVLLLTLDLLNLNGSRLLFNS